MGQSARDSSLNRRAAEGAGTLLRPPAGAPVDEFPTERETFAAEVCVIAEAGLAMQAKAKPGQVS